MVLSQTCYKADESINEELEAASVIKRRVDHLKEAELLHPHTKPLWHKKRLDRMLVEYFLRALKILILHKTLLTARILL
jgi:hypothetical protein